MPLKSQPEKLHRWLILQLQPIAAHITEGATHYAAQPLPAEIQQDAQIIRNASNSFKKLLQLPIPTIEGTAEDLRQHAHDLRNPLSAILGFSEYLLEDAPSPLVDDIYYHANTALIMIESVTYYVKLKTDTLRVPNRVNTFAGHTLLENIYCPVGVQVQQVPGDFQITGDRTQIAQIWNAYMHIVGVLSAGAGLVRVNLTPAGAIRHHASFSLAHTHPDLNPMLDAHWPRPADHQPWHLILYTLAQLATKHSGQVAWVPGENSTFTLQLPLDVTSP